MPHQRILFSAQVPEQDDSAVIRFTGGSLALTQDNAVAFYDLLHDAARRAGRRKLVLDFSNVVMVSSAGLGTLVRLHKELQAAGASLALRGLTDAVYEVFAVTRLTQLLDAGQAAAAPAPGGAPPCVLVADDDEGIRSLLGCALPRHGLRAVLAATGREALERYRQDAAAIDVALLDVNMPGLSGPETLAALRDLAPGLRCCFMTGDLGPDTEERLLAHGAARVFPKPFAAAEVAETLRRLAGNVPPRRDLGRNAEGAPARAEPFPAGWRLDEAGDG
jgi:anti-anti-sigma factor